MRSSRHHDGRSGHPEREVAGTEFPWLPFDVTARRFATTVDALILGCSVLLFWVVVLLWTHSFPALWLACVVTVGVGLAFRLIYWLAFQWLLRVTPGSMLAGLAGASRMQSGPEKGGASPRPPPAHCDTTPR